jgi:hypothetical protein
MSVYVTAYRAIQEHQERGCELSRLTTAIKNYINSDLIKVIRESMAGVNKCGTHCKSKIIQAQLMQRSAGAL